MRWLFVVGLSVVAGVPVVIAPVVAQAAVPDDVKPVVKEVAQIEHDTAEDIIGVIGAAFEVKNNPLSAGARGQYDTAKATHVQARQEWEAKHYGKAYRGFREALRQVDPVAVELLTLESPPQIVVDAVGREVERTNRRIDELATAVGKYATPEGKAAYADAKTSHAEAKALWSSGDRLGAYRKLGAALDKLEAAAKTIWTEE